MWTVAIGRDVLVSLEKAEEELGEVSSSRRVRFWEQDDMVKKENGAGVSLSCK